MDSATFWAKKWVFSLSLAGSALGVSCSLNACFMLRRTAIIDFNFCIRSTVKLDIFNPCFRHVLCHLLRHKNQHPEPYIFNIGTYSQFCKQNSRKRWCAAPSTPKLRQKKLPYNSACTTPQKPKSAKQKNGRSSRNGTCLYPNKTKPETTPAG